VGEIDIPIIEV